MAAKNVIRKRLFRIPLIIICTIFILLGSKVNRGFGQELVPVRQEPARNPILGGGRGSIFLHSGEFFYRVTDLSIPGRGFPFRFVRTYRSGSTYDGPLGFGWDFNYNARLQETTEGIVRFDGTGRRDLYRFDGNVHISPPGFYDRLDRQGNNTLTITDRDGTVQEYGLTGEFYRLVKITDRNGNQLTLSYNGSNQLSSITDTLGRQITAHYNGDGRITSLEDFAGRRISFAYDAQGNLISFTRPATDRYPAGNTFTYTYLPDHNLSSITDPKGQTFLQNSYNSRDQVIEQVYGDSSQKKFTYWYRLGWTIERDRNGNFKLYKYDANGNLSLFVQFIQSSDSQ
ncbi:DUF6531 domain-containing protein, partial [Acidobacteria bacterium AH-259-O06]|nr:DUF6531 domain-containing protein [Acidobacteria bacterium AH-259-O06]